MRHIPECRRRIERLAREEEDPRMKRIDTKNAEYDERLAQKVRDAHSKGGVGQEEEPPFSH